MSTTRTPTGEVARYLSVEATDSGGRSQRPAAMRTIAAAFAAPDRAWEGVGAYLCAQVAALATWLLVAQLQQEESGRVLVAALAALGLLAIGLAAGRTSRILATDADLLAAQRRWHAVNPAVAASDAAVLTSPAVLARLVLGGLASVALAVLAVLGIVTTDAGVSGARSLAWPAAASAGAAISVIATALLLRSARRMQRLARPLGPTHGAFAPPAQPGPAPVGARIGAAPGAGAGSAAQPAHTTWAPAATGAPSPAQTAPSDSLAGVDADPIADPGAEETITSRRHARHEATRMRAGFDHTPALLAVILPDGRTLPRRAVTLLGRDPRPRPEEQVGGVLVVDHATVSKTHAAIRLSDDSVHVTDRASTNGTSVLGPDRRSRRLAPWAEERVAIGSDVLLGQYRILVRYLNESPDTDPDDTDPDETGLAETGLADDELDGTGLDDDEPECDSRTLR